VGRSVKTASAISNLVDAEGRRVWTREAPQRHAIINGDLSGALLVPVISTLEQDYRVVTLDLKVPAYSSLQSLSVHVGDPVTIDKGRDRL